MADSTSYSSLRQAIPDSRYVNRPMYRVGSACECSLLDCTKPPPRLLRRTTRSRLIRVAA